MLFISGGTGSLGQALTKEILKFNPQSIRIYARDEVLHWEMQQHFNNAKLRFQIGDVRDLSRLKRAMTGVDYVIHTAAMKHVGFSEYNPIEAIRTNIDGSINVIDACVDCGVKKALLISSDKAVDPVSLYGATKLVQEKLFLHGNAYRNNLFSCIRFGNFIASRGSVIPLWKKQIANNEEITITDPNMSRYWISLEDAAKFTLKTLGLMKGEEIFIPKMQVKTIGELADEIAPQVPRRIIGKARGEKMTELLISPNEDRYCEEHEDYWIIRLQPSAIYTIPADGVY